MPLSSFHPAVQRWFQETLGAPTAAQAAAWPALSRGEHALIAAPTGSGKTLAAFLVEIDGLLREALAGQLADETRVLYVSPLRALSHDVHKNLELPLSGIRAELLRAGETAPEIRSWVRTSDTGPKARAQALKRPPHIVVTTPESLYLLLTSAGGRRLLGSVRTVIVDEIHALLRDKRGSHLALSLERLEALVRAQGSALQRIGLSATQRFCRSFNVELQAAANDDAIVLSLGPMHSFVLDELFRFLRADGVRDLLIQALLPAPMFAVRFRWNASRSLAITRFRGGKKVPPRFQRLAADDLLAVAFPDQVACAENLTGEREIPDHPLVRQTLDDCLHEAMDLDGLVALLRRIEARDIACVARDLREASPFAHEILSARPYAFLDDAPLEERRTQAVQLRRVAGESTSPLAALDDEAIVRVVREAEPEVRDPDELHDLLLVYGSLPAIEGRARGYEALFGTLCAAGRATTLRHEGAELWIATERAAWFRCVFPAGAFDPELEGCAVVDAAASARESSLRGIVRGRLELVGPANQAELCAALGLSESDVALALSTLEAEGFALRGRYRPGAALPEWCERRLLARMHRATLTKLRREIEPVATSVYLRYLFEHQGLGAESRRAGPEGLMQVIEQLAGFGASAAAWEESLLSLRVSDYAPELLDRLCLSGRVAWARFAPPEGRSEGPARTTKIVLYPRGEPVFLPSVAPAEPALSRAAAAVLAALHREGASFAPELGAAAGLDAALVHEALGELIGAGLVTSDGFAGLRALIAPAHERRAREGVAGRYVLSRSRTAPGEEAREEQVARLALILLRRWGVVFRKLLEREPVDVRWGELLRPLRRMEARGELRGGRFLASFGGEQFALPEAVTALRRLRNREPRAELVCISGSDPLNLVGILTPGARIPAQPTTRILLCDGEPSAVLSGGSVRFLTELDPERRALFEAALRSRATPGRGPGPLPRSLAATFAPRL